MYCFRFELNISHSLSKKKILLVVCDSSWWFPMLLAPQCFMQTKSCIGFSSCLLDDYFIFDQISHFLVKTNSPPNLSKIMASPRQNCNTNDFCAETISENPPKQHQKCRKKEMVEKCINPKWKFFFPIFCVSYSVQTHVFKSFSSLHPVFHGYIL